MKNSKPKGITRKKRAQKVVLHLPATPQSIIDRKNTEEKKSFKTKRWEKYASEIAVLDPELYQASQVIFSLIKALKKERSAVQIAAGMLKITEKFKDQQLEVVLDDIYNCAETMEQVAAKRAQNAKKKL